MTGHSRTLLGAVASLTVVASVASASAGQAVTSETFTLSVNAPIGSVVDSTSQFSLGGSTAVSVEAVDLGGGTTTVIAGPDANLPTAVDFPNFVEATTYPRAVLAVTPTAGEAFSPGSADFEYGAVFKLDWTSSGAEATDNGDNIFQRGRYADPAIFKLQVDHGHPSCLVKGSQGQVVVTSPTEIARRVWYHVSCSRVGSEVTLRVAQYRGSGEVSTTTVSGESGTLTFDAAPPASVGGKLNRFGEVASSTDQFNGSVAQVWVGPLQ
jgi:hypothetical protein